VTTIVNEIIKLMTLVKPKPGLSPTMQRGRGKNEHIRQLPSHIEQRRDDSPLKV